MADFLATFNLGLGTPAPPSDGEINSNREINSVGDLQSRLSVALRANTTSTRVEHVSLALELRSTARFTIAFSDGDNRALEGLGAIDPSLGGLTTSHGGATNAAGQATRVVSANDTLINQTDNSVLQRSVAMYILGEVSAVDDSTWILRDFSRGPQGWTFMYICKDSHQHWNRETSKNPPQAPIGEYSLDDPHPILVGRPAFDCRGCALILFNCSSQSIIIKYDHTPVHRTVRQLCELLPPPRRQLGPGAQKLLLQKTLKKSTPERKKTPSKKRQSQAGDENGQQPTKRRKKKQAVVSATEGYTVPPDYHDPSQAIAPLWREQPAYHRSTQGQGDGSQNDDDYPSKYVKGSEGAQRGSSGNQHVPQNGSASTVLPFNVSPDEAARRLNVARELLRGAGVNPDSLSIEQMNTLSNQAPNLQKDSIKMIAKFSAERLKIIQPEKKDKSKAVHSINTSSTQAQILHTVLGFSDPSTSESKAKGSSRLKRGLGKSRHTCSRCKSCKIKVGYLLLKIFYLIDANLEKCPKEIPACSKCQSSGQQCQYPSPKPKVMGPNTIVVEDEGDNADKGDGDHQDYTMRPQNNPQLEEPAPSLDHQQPEDGPYLQMLVAGMLSSSTEQPAPGSHPQDPSYFQSETGPWVPLPDMNTISPQSFPMTMGLALPRPSTAANDSTSSVAARENTASPISAQVTTNQQQPHASANGIQNQSPYLHTRTTNQQQVPPPRLPVSAITARHDQSWKSPFQGHQRTASQQGPSSQSQSPNAEPAMNRGYRPPPMQTRPTNDIKMSANYSNHAEGSNASSDLTYESLSSARSIQTISSTHSDYNDSRTAQTSSSTLNSAITSTANQWPTTYESNQERFYDNRPLNYSGNSYSQTRSLMQPALYVHNFKMPCVVQPQPKSAISEVKQQAYSQYPLPLHLQQQSVQQTSSNRMNHNYEWYDFNNGNANSFTPANHGWM